MSPFKNFKFFIAIAVIVFACCTPPKKAPAVTWLYHSAEPEKLNGTIKSITETTSNLLHDITYIDLDRQGNITNVKESFADQSREYEYATLFNKDGKKTKVIITHSKWGHPTDSVILKFNKRGLLTRRYTTTKFMPDNIFYKYNNEGYISEIEFYIDKHYLIYLRTFEYDKNQLVVQDNTYSNYGRYRAGLHFDRRDPRQYLTLDLKKNWIKMMRGEDTVTRKIIYY